MSTEELQVIHSMLEVITISNYERNVSLENMNMFPICLLYTSDAADDYLEV